MEDIWKRAKVFAEEAAKRSQALAPSSNRISDLVAETAKKSKELALEASKKADQFKTAALKQADQISVISISDIIPPHFPSLSISTPNTDSSNSSSGSGSVVSESELRKFGVTDDLKDFVKGFTSDTFKNFPIQDEVKEENEVVPSQPNVRKDLTEWQERHATLVLTNVKQISKLRYELCPRMMKERRFWRIYFTLVSTHVSPFEQEYTEELRQKAEEQKKEEKAKENTVIGESSGSAESEKNLKSKASNASSAEQDLDTFLLGDLEDSDGGAVDGDGAFDDDDDDFDKIDNSDIEDEKHSKKSAAAAATS